MKNLEKIYSFYVLSSEDNKEDIRYVGTTTRTIEERLRLHKYCATHPEKRGLPVHKWMYSVYKNGGKIISTKIGECFESEWENKEKAFIKEYKEKGYKLLNIDEGGKGSITAEKRSKDSIQRSIDAHKKAIVAYNLDGTFYKKYDSITEASKELNLNSHNNIINVLKGRSKSASGLIWRYEKDINENIISAYKTDRHGKYVYQFDINGNLIGEFETIKDIINTYKGSYNGINSAIKNKKYYNNFYWSFNKEINIAEFESPFKYKVFFNGSINYFQYHKEVRNFVGCSQTFLDNHFTKKPSDSFIYSKDNNKYLISKIDHFFTEEEKKKVL